MPWPVHPTGFFGARGDSDTYRIERSLRFNSADNANLSRTMGTPTSQTTATLSLWVKRSGISKTNFGDVFWDAEASNYNIFGFAGTGSGNTDSLLFSFRNGGTYYSNAVYRDPSAWYHVVCVYDSTNATQADRFRFFVNGVRGTFISSPAFALNYTFEGSIGAGAYRIGDFTLNSSWRPDFYLAEYYWIDGQALSPSSFGETDAITGRWKAKAYSGTYGTNGFYLKFADNSGTTSTTLGKDSSGNGNNWTPNNFSVTAGAGNDSLVDSPSNYGTDTGVGGEVRGNYCNLNPLDKSSNITLANGNLDYSQGATTGICRSTIGISSGKWYWEILVTATNPIIGIAKDTASLSGSYVGADANGWGYYGNDGAKYTNGSSSSYGSTYTTNDIIGVAFNADTGSLVFYKNNVSQGTAFTGLTSGPYFPAISRGNGSPSASFNFGQRPFAYTAPSGFKALCTQNLPQPTIQKPSKYMDVVLRTGTGTTGGTVSSLSFEPDFLWTKTRSTAGAHTLHNSVIGSTKYLQSHLTAAEVTDANYITSFNSNGYTIGTADWGTGITVVDWAWDAGSTNSTNTSGSITSTVRANPQAGFSIVSYTGNGTAGATVGHGLGVAPKMIIAKFRSTTSDWPVYHASITNAQNGGLNLNKTDAFTVTSSLWNNTSPTSSVFTIGSGLATNLATVIAYCFAEIEGYSKFGSYTGNNSTDGPFVWCGFRPKYIMVKKTSATGPWMVFDSSRDSFNVATTELRPNETTAEPIATRGSVDLLSNGFKIRSTSATFLGELGDFIFAAFAESPFKYARAR